MRMAKTDTFSYDPKELLSQVSYGVGGSSTMTWDADQQRQKLTNSGGSTYFVYDPTAGVPAVLVETDGENETFYVREPGGELIARATGQTRQYYFFDRLGSTVAMVPAVEGNPTDRLFYTPWGELVTSGSRASTVGTTANPYRYVGQLGYYYHHQDPGLQDWMQLGVRLYQPGLGRFERRDPAQAPAWGAYVFAEDRPTAASDPTGNYTDATRKDCVYYDQKCKQGQWAACRLAEICRGFGESKFENCMRGCLISEYESGPAKPGRGAFIRLIRYAGPGHARCAGICAERLACEAAEREITRLYRPNR